MARSARRLAFSARRRAAPGKPLSPPLRRVQRPESPPRAAAADRVLQPGTCPGVPMADHADRPARGKAAAADVVTGPGMGGRAVPL